jgi:hypothetical protein
MNRILVRVVVAACCLLACLVMIAGVFLSFAPCSAGCTLQSGRSVNVESTGLSLSLNSSRDTAVIQAKGRKIVVAPTLVHVDGRPVAKIDASVKDVKVTVARREISIAGDGTPIATVK